MLAQTMNPSPEGMWTRLAPIAAALSVATGFVLALIVLVSAVDTSQTLLGRARLEQRQKEATQRALVQKQLPASPYGG